MKNLRLIPDIHRDQSLVNVLFTYDPKSNGASLKATTKKAAHSNRVTPHRLRHSFATHLLEQGISLRHIQVLLGHNSSKTTEHHTQVSVQEIGKIKNPLDDFTIQKAQQYMLIWEVLSNRNKNIMEMNTP